MVMRHTTRTLAVMLCVSSLLGLVVASPLRAEGPTTAPAADHGKILVLPFASLNRTDSQAWLGRSIQQSLVADLTVVAPARATAGDAEANDTDAALDAGRRAGAAYVVFGSFASVNQALRVTGQVLDVSAGKPVTGLKATGAADEVFRLEDQLATEIRRGLGLGPTTPPAPATQAPTAETQAPYGPLSVETPMSPDEYYSNYANPPVQNQYYYNSYYYQNPYSYPGYDGAWDYPWWGFGGVLFFGDDFGRHGRHFRDFDRDFNGRGRQFADRSVPGVGAGTLHAGAGTFHAGAGTFHAGAGTFHAGAGTFHGGGGAAHGGGGHR